MQMALDLATRGRGFTSPNPMVGAVVVKDNVLVGRGYHAKLGDAHAEVNALDDAGEQAHGATLYVTLEPCNHFGRTPPCTHKIIESGIRRVVIAMADPNPGVRGGGADYLKSQGLEVTLGLCEAQAQQLNEAFIKYVQTDQPFFIVKCAATLDGQLATRTGDAKWVTGESARHFVHEIRHAVDAILVGVDTVKQDNPQLTTRLPEAKHGLRAKDPVRIILDTRLTIPAEADVLQQKSDAPTIIVVGNQSMGTEQSALKERLMSQGVQVLEVPQKDGRIDLRALPQILGRLEIMSVLIEGGGTVIGAALKAGIVDKILLFFAPKLLGGNDGVPVCKGQGVAYMNQSIAVNDIRIQRFGNDILIEGYPAQLGN